MVAAVRPLRLNCVLVFSFFSFSWMNRENKAIPCNVAHCRGLTVKIMYIFYPM